MPQHINVSAPVHHHQATAVNVEASVDPAAVADILAFWFDRDEPLKAWFSSADAMDLAIQKDFLPLMQAAARGDCDGWQQSADGTLALLILLDQFPRNVYRGRGQAFATDQKAVQVALRAIAAGQDQQVPFIRQVFFYLPLEHDEDMKSQVACVALYRLLLGRATLEQRTMGQAFLEFAERHQRTIARFGRFPGRNAALGRTSDAAELRYLKDHPMGF